VAEENDALRNSRGSRNGSSTRTPRTIVISSPATATVARIADTSAGSRPEPSDEGRDPSSVRDPSSPRRNNENTTAPTRSTRPARRGVSQPVLAAHAIASARIPIGTLT
jgi:hypothetical protein